MNTQLAMLRGIVIPAMRIAERKLYNQTNATRDLWENYKEATKNLSPIGVFYDLKRLRYASRFPWENYVQHPGHTIYSQTGICKDVAFLLHALWDNSHYIELWKTPLNGHAMVVYQDYVFDFHGGGIRMRGRTKDDPIEACSQYYTDILFAQENFKMLKKYGNF